MRKINVLIAEDHVLTAHLLEQYLKSSKDIEITGIAANGLEALEMLEANRDIDVILLDINMPKLDGIQTLTEIVVKYPDTKAIMLTYLNEPYIIQKALKIGASGYITKNADCEEIINSIITVNKGGHYLSKDGIDGIISNYEGSGKKPSGLTRLSHLTEREKEILNLIAKGDTNAEIAQKLFLSIRTIESHRRTILHKFGEKNFVSLIKFLVDNRMLDAEDDKQANPDVIDTNGKGRIKK